MIIRIENETFETAEITQLYPAVIVRTGYEEETTQMSLEWYDEEGRGRVEIEGYALFVQVGEAERRSFLYEKREALEAEIGRVAKQLQGGS